MNGELISFVFLLLLILDPLGNMPVVLSLLRNVPEARRSRIILRECCIDIVVMIGFLLIGDHLLALMRLSDPALTISGGLILFLIALRMVFPQPLKTPTGDDIPANDPFIVPLAVPMIAGPTALATVLLASRQSGDTLLWVGAIVVAGTINTICLLTSGWFARIFGKAGMEAMERLMGLILITMAVQMLISGIRVAFQIGG